MITSQAIIFLASLITVVSAQKSQPDWWKTSVFYRINVPTFSDSDHDGFGDLKGVVEKMDYFKTTGINAIWLSPIYNSSTTGYGDIMNYTHVNPYLGDMDVFDSLLKKAKELGIKVVLDLIPNHTSDMNEWFSNSIKKLDPYTDYYVWKDPLFDEEGKETPPNNWTNVNGESAWEWNEERRQYYLHQFEPQQPDLNYRSPQVIQEMNDILTFWLDKGVDGFALQDVSYLLEDTEVKNNPNSNKNLYTSTQNLPETYNLVQQWRQILDERKAQDGITRILILDAIGTIKEIMEYYGTEDRPGGQIIINHLLNNLLDTSPKSNILNDTIHQWLSNLPDGAWITWMNNDFDQNTVIKWYSPEIIDGLNMLAMLLPGSPATRNGEEFGVDNPYAQIPDHKMFNQSYKSYTYGAFYFGDEDNRDDDVDKDEDYDDIDYDDNLDDDEDDKNQRDIPLLSEYLGEQSEIDHYKLYQCLVETRKLPVMISGSLRTYVISDDVFAFSRELNGQVTFIAVINLGTSAQNISLDVLSNVSGHLTVYLTNIKSRNAAGSEFQKSNILLYPSEALLLTGNSNTSTDYPIPNICLSSQHKLNEHREAINENNMTQTWNPNAKRQISNSDEKRQIWNPLEKRQIRNPLEKRQIWNSLEKRQIWKSKERRQIWSPQEKRQIWKPQERRQIWKPQEKRQIWKSEEKRQIWNPQEKRQIWNPLEKREIWKPKEKRQIWNPQEKRQIWNQESKRQIWNPLEKRQIWNPEEKRQIWNPQEKRQIWEQKEKKQIWNPQEKRQIWNPQEKRQIWNQESKRQIWNPLEKRQIWKSEEKRQIWNPQEKRQIWNQESKRQIWNPLEKRQIWNSEEKRQIWNPQEKRQIWNPQEKRQIWKAKEKRQIWNPQEKRQIWNPQEKRQIWKSEEKRQIWNPQDKRQIWNPQEKRQIWNQESKRQIWNPLEKRQIWNPEEKRQIWNPQE